MTNHRRDFFKIIGGALGLSALSYYLGARDTFQPAPVNDLPDYADGGIGFPVFRAPYLQKDARIAAFLFQADMEKLTDACNQTLNVRASSPFEYKPLMPNVLLVYSDMLVSSLDERDAQVGLIPEREVGFWVLTIAMQKTSTGSIPHHLAWFLPYLLVDESASIATGREVYGFNKLAAQIQKADEIRSPRFAADVLGFKKFAPESIAQNERLLEFDSSSETSQSAWNDWSAAKRDLTTSLLKNVRADLGNGLVEFAARAVNDNVSFAFLKQLRHAGDTTKACYQTVVEAPMKVKNFYDGGMFLAPRPLTIHHLDSHPIARRLGMEEKSSSSIGAWMKVDFELQEGIEL